MDIQSPRRWMQGVQAVWKARQILTTPGWCAIDFETYPTAPRWHGDQAAARAPRGRQGAAREEAELRAKLDGRAHRRTPCTLQLRHERGAELFVRLLDPGRELPEMFDPVVDARPWEDCASLVAHNSQFETEVLLSHGVAVDVDCTMLAAKALYLEAVPEDSPQPVRFGLADLVAKEFGRSRDKEVRNRDWRDEASLDAEAVEYGLQDVRDTLDLWALYRTNLEVQGLVDGYVSMQRAVLPTAVTNMVGLLLDAGAHDALTAQLKLRMRELAVELDEACSREIGAHGSTALVSRWIIERVLGHPIKPPEPPKLEGLVDFLCRHGGLRPRGELVDPPKRLVKHDGLRWEEAASMAEEAGYIGRMRGYGQMDLDPEDADPDELVAAIERELRGERVLAINDQADWDRYCEASEYFEALHVEEPLLLSKFNMRLHARTRGAVKGWRWTAKTGHLAITKGSQAKKAEQLAEAFPDVAEYLSVRVRWNKWRKLRDAFGPALRRWQDGDGRVRGQFRVWAAWTGRQSCVDPNLQQQPREEEFRALWVAAPGRKLVVADYSQIELRLLAVESGDERLREVYRRGLDVHAETAKWAFGVVEPTKAQRQAAKAINFGIAYGCGAAGLSEASGFTLDESRVILARVLGAYPGLARYRERAPAEARAQGFIAIRPGRRVAFDPERSPATTAINAPIQGGAASVQMRALRLVHDGLQERAGAARTRDAGFRLSNQADAAERALAAFRAFLEASEEIKLAASVHDEIILDCAEGCADEAATLLVDCMTRALLEIYSEAEEMGLARLTAATVCDRWSEKA